MLALSEHYAEFLVGSLNTYAEFPRGRLWRKGYLPCLIGDSVIAFELQAEVKELMDAKCKAWWVSLRQTLMQG